MNGDIASPMEREESKMTMNKLILEAIEEARESWDFDTEERMWTLLQNCDGEEEDA